MAELRALIAAAGTGTRAGLPYPKTLHPVRGRPILLRLLKQLHPYDAAPTVVVSPAGEGLIRAALDAAGASAALVVQKRPTGMGDAVLAVRSSPRFDPAGHLLLAWGDIPLLGTATIAELVERHLTAGNDFTFVTRNVAQAYTRVRRDAGGAVAALEETRELGVDPTPGERDIGLFCLRAAPILDLLDQRLPGATGRATGEHGFLYVVAHAVAAGLRVDALPIAKAEDCISLNRLSDLAGVEE